MNWNHVNASLKEAFLYHGNVDGTRVVSNGYVMFAVPESFEIPERGKEHPPLVKLWRSALMATVGASETVCGCAGTGKDITRKIGNRSLAERWVRCFSSGVAWTLAPSKTGQMMLAHRDGVLIGAVMPMSETYEPNWRGEPTDAEVFGPYACEANDWYLIDSKTIAAKLRKARIGLSQAEDRVTGAKAEVTEWEAQIAKIESLQEAHAA